MAKSPEDKAAEKAAKDAQKAAEKAAKDAAGAGSPPSGAPRDESEAKKAFRNLIDVYEKQNPAKFNLKDSRGISKKDTLLARLAEMA